MPTLSLLGKVLTGLVVVYTVVGIAYAAFVSVS